MASKALATTQPAIYGAMKPAATINADRFAEHDHGKVWDDGGEAQEMGERITGELTAYGAEQAKKAVLEYLTNAFADLCVLNGQLCIMVDGSNNEEPLTVIYKAADLFQAAMEGAEKAGDREVVNAIGEFLNQLQASFQTAPAPTPVVRTNRGPARQGGVRPVAGRAGPGGSRPAGRTVNPRAAVQTGDPGE